MEITDDMDSMHNDEPIESIDILEDVSCVLEACKPYCIQEFNEQHSPLKTFGCFSCSFLNIDGNASNFDFLAVTNSKLGLLRRTCHFTIDKKQKRTFYLTIVRSLFEHCSALWSPQYPSHIRKFEAIQRRAIK